MDSNKRPIILGGALTALAIIALFVIAPIYGVLGLAVLLLAALMVANRLRVSQEELDEALDDDNDDATERLGDLFGDAEPTSLDDLPTFRGPGTVDDLDEPLGTSRGRPRPSGRPMPASPPPTGRHRRRR
ncbi:MAG: hypothetical protein U5R31_13585 [Acidimicrobiia bacterium]|nr:hypothetical protein [Acidimicrobiia bacterium]